MADVQYGTKELVNKYTVNGIMLAIKFPKIASLNYHSNSSTWGNFSLTD